MFFNVSAALFLTEHYELGVKIAAASLVVPCYTCENEQRVTFLCLSICILSPQFIHFAKVSKDKLKETFLEGFEKMDILMQKIDLHSF
jgi:hypothetical protein